MLANAMNDLLLRLLPFRGKNWLLRRRILAFTRHARTYYGPVMLTDMRDSTNCFIFFGSYGNELKNLIQAMPIDGVFVDIGANAGLYSLLADAHLVEGAVYSFEPSHSTYETLLANLRLNRTRRTTAFNFGIGLETELVAFRRDPRHTGGAALARDSASGERVLIVNGGEVLNAMKLDADRHCLVKIDTEGAEFGILRTLAAFGALKLIDRLYVEINDGHLAAQDASADAIYDLLEEHGFIAETDRRGKDHYDEIFSRPSGTAGEGAAGPPAEA